MSYSNGLLSDQSYQTANKYVQRGLPGVGFKLTDTGDYDMQNKKLVNVDEGENNQDVVNKHQLDVGLQTKPNKTDVLLLDGTSHMVGDLDLRGNKIILPGEIQMDRKLITNLDTDENQDLSAVNMITLKNKVEPKADKDYVDFEITKQNALINNTFVKKTGDQMNGDLILPHDSYPVDGNTNKAISYETQREIFLSRRESFPMQADINMNNNFIQNIATPTSSHQGVNKGYCDYNFLNRQKGGRIMGSLSMNQNDLFEIPAPKYGSSAANKNYVDNQMGTKADLSKTTTQTFQGRVQVPDFNSGGHNGSDIVNLRYIDGIFLNKKTGGTLNNPITFLSSLPSNQRQIHNIGSPQFNSSAANKQYVDGEIGKIASVDTTQFIKKDGLVPMAADLDMGTHKIINVGQPTTDTDAASKGYIDNTLAESHLISSHKSNEFKYLNDPNETSSEYNITVEAFTDFNESPHKNKKAFEITLQKDAGTNDYRSRMGFNLYPLPLGTYTIIFKYYFPENTNIQLSCQSTTAYVHKQIQKDFTDYSKLLVQINNNSKATPDYLFFTIHGTAVVNNPEGYVIVYGVKDWSDSVDPNIYDDGFYVQMFQYKNGDMQMQTNINVNNHKITNLNEGINDTDAVNKLQLDSVSIHTNNQTYREIFNEFYDLVETSRFNVNTNSYGLVILGVKPNLFFQSNRLITNYDRSFGIQLSNSYINLGDDVDQNSSYTIFISLYFSDDIKIQFSDINQNIFYPSFSITYNNSRLRINRSLYLHHHIIIPADFKNKQVMLWVCHNAPNNLYRFAISNHTSFIQSITSPASFKTKILRIIYNNHVKKIGLVKKFININSLDYHRIMLEELREGSFFR